MGFFTDLWESATPWSSAEAEAVSGGTGTDSTPAQGGEAGEGEAADKNASTSDNKDGDDDAEEPEEEEEEEELEDPQEKFQEECKESKQCSGPKHHFDECVERVTGASESEDKKGPSEDCVEEFFHLAHCANECAAPKLWAALK
ncbi:hypothetical protein BP5796_00219 [Coleophoma crateriformis]|uniref:Cytochrome b-c1 complex subunit 6, mitochondrial n=1 Tax=Coleophoma crateriformis TaxID=565419 RepID=A0A3D8T7C9_9HELO|nr:hypothetical protein BP5796_00219 [Coleophoma crateriformis]